MHVTSNWHSILWLISHSDSYRTLGVHLHVTSNWHSIAWLISHSRRASGCTWQRRAHGSAPCGALGLEVRRGTPKWVMSRTNESRRMYQRMNVKQKCQVKRTNVSFCTIKASYVQQQVSHGTHERVSHGTHKDVSHGTHEQMCHVARIKASHVHQQESNGKHKQVSHGTPGRVSHVAHMKASSPRPHIWMRHITYQGLISCVAVSHVAHIKASSHVALGLKMCRVTPDEGLGFRVYWSYKLDWLSCHPFLQEETTNLSRYSLEIGRETQRDSIFLDSVSLDWVDSRPIPWYIEW